MNNNTYHIGDKLVVKRTNPVHSSLIKGRIAKILNIDEGIVYMNLLDNNSLISCEIESIDMYFKKYSRLLSGYDK